MRLFSKVNTRYTNTHTQTQKTHRFIGTSVPMAMTKHQNTATRSNYTAVLTHITLSVHAHMLPPVLHEVHFCWPRPYSGCIQGRIPSTHIHTRTRTHTHTHIWSRRKMRCLTLMCSCSWTSCCRDSCSCCLWNSAISSCLWSCCLCLRATSSCCRCCSWWSVGDFHNTLSIGASGTRAVCVR